MLWFCVTEPKLASCTPAILRHLPENYFDKPIPDKLELKGFKCHSQLIESTVQHNAKFSKRVKESGDKRDGMTRVRTDYALSTGNRSTRSKNIAVFSKL